MEDKINISHILWDTIVLLSILDGQWLDLGLIGDETYQFAALGKQVSSYLLWLTTIYPAAHSKLSESKFIRILLL